MDRSYVTSWGDSGIPAPDLFIRYAGGTLPYPKLVSGSIGTVFAPEMMPTDLYIVSQQGPTTTDVLLSEFGQCPAPTQESFSVGVPPSASQMFDTTFGLPVPGALQAGDSVRAIRSTRGSTRFVIHRQAPRQRRLPYLSSVHGGAAIGTKGYGDFPYTDEHGITHQPVGRVDPVVNRTQINVLYDGKTVKLNAATNELYADILGMDAPGSASDTIPPGPLHAGRGLVITPGPGPADPPAVTMQAGGSIEDGKYQWAWSILRGGKETGLSPGQTGTAGDVTTGGTTTTYRSASIDLPGVLTGDPATAVKLYRRDTSIGADGTIHTKFVYASHGVGVLVSDPSVGAVISDTGSLSGYYVYTVVTTKGPIVAGMVFVYNALAYVTTDDPPLLIDPRDGSTTTLDVSSNGESAFVTSDGGVLNPTNGDITYPTSSAKNLTTFKLVASLAITPLTYVDTLSNTALGATYQRDVQTIHNLPFGGDGIQLHDLELDDFHHYIVHNIRLSTDADGTNVSGLTINAPYVGLPGQDLSITEASGTYPNALAVRLNPDTMEFDSEWRISAIGGGGGGSRRAGNYTIDSNFVAPTGWSGAVYIPWNECVNGSSAYLDIANTDGLTIPAGGDGDYSISATVRIDASGATGAVTFTSNWSVETVLSIQLFRAGVQLMYAEQEEFYQDQVANGDEVWTDPTFKIDAVVPATQAGDVIKIGLKLAGGGALSSGAEFYVWGGWAGTAASPNPIGGWESWVSIAPVG